MIRAGPHIPHEPTALDPSRGSLVAIDNSRSMVAVEPASDLSVKSYEVKALAINETIIAPHTTEALAPVGSADLHSNEVLGVYDPSLVHRTFGPWNGKRHGHLQWMKENPNGKQPSLMP